VGPVPALILIVSLGVFAVYTSFLLIDFKLNHPEVHNMGDAGTLTKASLPTRHVRAPVPV